MEIFAQSFTWLLPNAVQGLLGRSLMGLICILSFLGNNKQHVPTCTNMISAWVNKVLGVVQAHIAPSTLQGVAVLADFVAGISLMSILQADDWASLYSNQTTF